MTELSKLDLIRLARELTGSSDIDSLISSSNKISNYLSIKPAQMSELYVKSSFDLFIKRLKIRTVNVGTLDFVPYDYQVEVARFLDRDRSVVINHARQMGISVLTMAYSLWYAMNNSDKTIMVQCSSFSAGLEHLERIKFFYESLPLNYRIGVVEYNKGTITFENGTKITTRAVSADSIRGLSVDLIVLDQAAYISYSRCEEYMEAVTPIMLAGARMIMTSTPKMAKGLFYDAFTGSPHNGFDSMTMPWDKHPDRDAEWEKKHREMLGDAAFEQEFNCKFSPAE